MEDVAIAEVAKGVLDLIQGSYMDMKIQITIADDLPMVRINRTRMGEVIQNLLTNALKFMGDQPAPCIEIADGGLDEITKHPIIFVKDHGIGIEPKYHSQIFGLFNRLNSETEGTGVGLTLVKRIVEMYGGRIWVKSEGAGKGSAFYLTLPPVKNSSSN